MSVMNKPTLRTWKPFTIPDQLVVDPLGVGCLVKIQDDAKKNEWIVPIEDIRSNGKVSLIHIRTLQFDPMTGQDKDKRYTITWLEKKKRLEAYRNSIIAHVENRKLPPAAQLYIDEHVVPLVDGGYNWWPVADGVVFELARLLRVETIDA